MEAQIQPEKTIMGPNENIVRYIIIGVIGVLGIGVGVALIFTGNTAIGSTLVGSVVAGFLDSPFRMIKKTNSSR